MDMDIHVRTTIRHDYSYIEAAAIRIGDNVLEVASFGDYAWNGISAADMNDVDDDLTGIKIVHSNPNPKTHQFDIMIGPKTNITIGTFKDLVSVKFVGASMDLFGDGVGLMGAFVDGAMLGRDGITLMEDDINAFGQEWQVREDEPKLFRVARSPQAPMEQCKLPSVDAKEGRRRLGETVARSAAERACSHFSGAAFENCVFDVMAIGGTFQM